jgi:glycosyltransferase involved in cell wall biosynthesis
VDVIVSYPGNFMHAQQAARAFNERHALSAFVTAVNFNESNFLRKLGAHLPSALGHHMDQLLSRRAITQVPPSKIKCYPWLEILRTVLSRYIKNPIYGDMAWDAFTHHFDRCVARRHLEGNQAVFAFEYGAQYTFDEAARRGIARILALASTDSKEFEAIKNREEASFPELRAKHHRYFAKHFDERYERKRAEISAADVIVANSEVTRLSHIKAGVDPDKIRVVPLAAPPPVPAVVKPEADIRRPLSVVWAGPFSIRKGAHYFIDAWRMLAPGRLAQAQVYGSIDLPERALRPMPQGLTLAGSVAQPDLLTVFELADVLVFPTLADGFGMVVTEAFSRGLPVITTDKAGASELVKHGWNGLIVPAGDPVLLSDGLRWCLDNRKALYDMRFHALETARRCQWSDHRRRLIATVTEGLHDRGYAADFEPAANDLGNVACEHLTSAS